ncbi:hypothetical protein FGG08_003463 [Glutinoglossum americanum]|uniref:Delta 8-(E)-sphingolipid desaturase n=1 Tax=Glutinoglossum americanum TaxID=1670608 RepID=A0A9P8HY72_9PEZI|nr:hypothetical protein FGG08_003463 [Glutinoglossum americanum]
MPLPTGVVDRRSTNLSRRQVEGLVADGHAIIIVDGKVLKVDAWLNYHPGGDKAIMHMVGRDATDEVNALHSLEARRRMNAYQIGQFEGLWENFLPPIQGGQFRAYDEGGEKARGRGERSDLSSSWNSSRSSTPSLDGHAPLMRCRGPRSVAESPSSSSVSSLSSSDFAEHKAEETMPSYIDAWTKREIDLDLSTYPPLDPVTQDEIVRKYRLLHDRIKAEGLYKCHYTSYLTDLCRYVLLFSLCLLFLRWGWYGASGMFLGLFWHQLVFTAHDAGHMGITHDFTTDTVIGIIIADFLGGLSLGWWKRSHNVHHIVTNSPEHDPDIEHLPFFAISHRLLSSLRSTYYDRIMPYDSFAQFFVRYQSYLYYLVLAFGRFNLYRLSWEYLILGLGPRKGPAWWHRWFEILGNVVFWYWFGYRLVYKEIPTTWSRFVFVMVSHIVTMPLHVQITLSHFAMSTADLGVRESFPQKMLRTTMDVDCPEWLDFIHGGLQFQAIHHLYPRIPRHNLRRTQTLVIEFCKDVGLPYALYGFVEGNKEVIGRLADVARQAAILAQCQRVVSERTDLGHHT